MKILDNMEACYGCGACCNVCPTEAISMKANADGFLEPVIDAEKCISCGNCKKVCPSINRKYSNNPEPDIYAFSAEEKVLYNSSSGGVFTFLAEYILQSGGCVVGAAYDSKLYVKHIIINSIEELDKIRRSKYLQSSVGDTYKKTKSILEKGKTVLYSGCPCQIAGLLRFLEKDYENLYTVDLLCHGVPSPGLFQEYLNHSYGGSDKVADVEFRSREGWASLFKVRLKNGEVKTVYNDKSVYMQAFLQDINLRASCFQCQYSKLPRQGDITIGDLWAAARLNLSFEYKKGVSVVLTNNEKGSLLFQNAISGAKNKFYFQKLHGREMEQACNIKLLNENIFRPSACNSSIIKRRQFFDACLNMNFEGAVHKSLHKFDVGLILYMSSNYGSIMTNYSLYRAVNDMGRKIAVLDNLFPLGNEAVKFAKSGYMKLCSDFMETDDWRAANQCFDIFLVGSDMSWEWRQLKRYPLYMMLGFADDDKRKISYAPSFGTRKGIKEIDENARMLYSYYLKRFDSISVREDYGMDMCRDLFDVQAKQVMDPVFLCDKEVWSELAARSKIIFEEEYLLAYILDPTPGKRQLIAETAKNLNKKLFVILDLEKNHESNKKKMNLDENIVRPDAIGWLAYFQHASYVITDSFHGVCFSIMFGKKFVAIKNRSKQRFDSLGKLIECSSLFYDDATPLLGKRNIFDDAIDYDAIYQRIDAKRQESRQWLQAALSAEKKPKTDDSSAELMAKMIKSLQTQTELVNRLQRSYAYEEKQKDEINTQLKTGKAWFEIICERNHIAPQKSELRSIIHTQEYFSFLQSSSNYIFVFSCADECAVFWRRFVETFKLPLRKDLTWRDSYVAVIDGGEVKVDEKAKEELNIDYIFVAGNPSCSVEYADGHLKVDCVTMNYSKIKIKSKGFTEPTGAYTSRIIVDNIDYSMNRLGINVVVIENKNGGVVDSVNINTHSDSDLKINRR